jgi:WhiB family redox-sensing transcriptional regulator
MSRRLAWQERAACAGLPTEWFFPETGGRGGDAKKKATALEAAVVRATSICAGCPVQRDCRQDDAEFGIWGGEVRGAA